MKKAVVLLVFAGMALSLTGIHRFLPGPDGVYVPASPQRSGDPKSGYQYLTTGDYLRSGIPLNYFKLGFGKSNQNLLQREGINKEIPYEYTAVTAANGEVVVAPNCLQCHAQVFEGKLQIGLGNSTMDFTGGQKLDPQTAISAEKVLQRLDAKKYEAAEPFLRVVKGIGAQLHTQVRGVNAADRLAALLAAHRDPRTFQWKDDPILDIPKEVVPSDVPAWWLLKRKHAMFYSGFGRGDFGRFLMASNLLTVNDTAESRQVDSRFNDVLAYLQTIQPPAYPGKINQTLAREGGVLFINYCSKCHGNPHTEDSYPNLLIPQSRIGTDSLLWASNHQSPQFIQWFNQSWFSQGDHPARLEPFNGYIAPPLDGIWITAPYLHNGSVPTLEALLDSRLRPTYWSRDFNILEYDYQKVGWKYSKEDSAASTSVYNTTLPGYRNSGHTFSDRLSDHQRSALLEYLKTF